MMPKAITPAAAPFTSGSPDSPQQTGHARAAIGAMAAAMPNAAGTHRRPGSAFVG